MSTEWTFPLSGLELLSDSTPLGLLSVVRTKVVSGRNRKRAIASTPVNTAVIYKINGAKQILYPKVPTPTQISDDKTRKKAAETDATHEGNQINARPPTAFVEEKYIGTNSRR